MFTDEELRSQASECLAALSSAREVAVAMRSIAHLHYLTTTRDNSQLEYLAGQDLNPLAPYLTGAQPIDDQSTLLLTKILVNLAYAKDESNTAFLFDHALPSFLNAPVGSNLRQQYLAFFRNLAASDLEIVRDSLFQEQLINQLATGRDGGLTER